MVLGVTCRVAPAPSLMALGVTCGVAPATSLLICVAWKLYAPAASLLISDVWKVYALATSLLICVTWELHDHPALCCVEPACPCYLPQDFRCVEAWRWSLTCAVWMLQYSSTSTLLAWGVPPSVMVYDAYYAV